MSKKVAWTAGIIVLIGALFYSIPFILSTSWGSKMLLSAISRTIPGKIEARSVTLRWFSPQRIENLRLYGTEEGPILQVDSITMELTLWQLVWGRLSFGKTEVVGPQLNLVMDRDSSNLQRALIQPKTGKAAVRVKTRRRPPVSITGAFSVRRGQWMATGSALPRGSLDELEGTVHLPASTLVCTATTGSAAGSGVLKASGQWPPEGEKKVMINASALPISITEALIRWILGWPGLAEILGEALNIDFRADLHNGEGDLALVATSQVLECHAAGDMRGGTVSLTKPASLSLSPVPSVALPHSIRLTEGSLLTIRCPTYVAKWPHLDAPNALEASGRAEGLVFAKPELQTMEIQEAWAEIRKGPAPLRLQASARGPDFSLEGAFSHPNEGLSASLKGIHLPLPWIDLLLPTPLTPYLGSHISVEGTLTPDQLAFKADSPLLTLPEATLVLDEQITLSESVPFTYRLTPDLFPPLAEVTPLDCLIESLYFPFAWLKGEPFDPAVICLHGRALADWIRLKKLPVIGADRVENFFFGLDGPSLADGRFQFNSHFFPTAIPYIDTLAIPVVANGLFSVSKKLSLSLPRFRLAFMGESLRGRFIATYDSPDTFGLLFPGELLAELTPDRVPTLARPAQFQIECDPAPVVWSSTQPDQIDLSGRFSLPLIEMRDGEGLKALLGNFSLSGESRSGHLQFKGETFLPDVADAPFEGEVNLHRLPDVHGTAKLRASHFPTVLLSLFRSDPPLSNLIGPAFKVEGQTRFEQLIPFRGEVKASVDSELLQADCGLKLADALSLLSKKRPAFIRWTATPKGFDALYTWLKKKSPLSLNESATLSAQVSALNWPRNVFDPTNTSLVLNASSTALSLTWDAQRAVLSDLAANFDSKNFAKQIQASFKGTLATDTQGSFQLAATARNLFSGKGIEGSRLDMKGRLQNLQTPILFDLLPFPSETADLLNALLGNQVSGNIQAKVDQLSGPCSAQIESENTTLALDGRLKKGELLLNKPFQASSKVTPELGAHLLKWTNPLFFSAVRSDNPVTLSIDNEGFACPLFPFDSSLIRLPKGTLDLGKLYLTDRDPLTFLLNLFKLGKPGQEILAWSTPLYFHMGDGKLTYERMDTLFGKALHCAFWGTAELPSRKARMNLAVMPDSLETLLGLSKTPSNPLVIPFKGNLGHLRADWKTPALGIAALAAKEQGKGGALIGGALDLLSGKTKVPPPTTTPFPWEGPE